MSQTTLQRNHSKENGKRPERAFLLSASDIKITIVKSTYSNLYMSKIFLPSLFMQDV